MKAWKWGLLGLVIALGGIAGYLFIGGKSPIQWTALSYTEALAEGARAGKPVLIDFSSPL